MVAGTDSEAEVLRLRKKHFEHREKFNYLAQCDIDPEQDGNFLRELEKVLENKEVGQRYKIPTTSIEIENVKDKMEDIIHFADIISEENARLKMEELANIDIFKQNKQAVEDLTARIFANFEKAFKVKYVTKITNTSKYLAAQMFDAYKLSLVSQETQVPRRLLRPTTSAAARRPPRSSPSSRRSRARASSSASTPRSSRASSSPSATPSSLRPPSSKTRRKTSSWSSTFRATSRPWSWSSARTSRTPRPTRRRCATCSTRRTSASPSADRCSTKSKRPSSPESASRSTASASPWSAARRPRRT